MVRCCCVLFCACLLMSSNGIRAHGTESHGEKPAPTVQTASSAEQADHGQPAADAPDTAAVPRDATQGVAAERSEHTGSRITVGGIIDDLTWSEFPTLHPMIVHLPVTLIPAAFVFAIVTLFSAGRTFVWLAFAFALLGLASGLIAAFPAHPHTRGLSAAASLTLEKHDFFAYTTLWLTALGVFAALICLWKPLRWMRLSLTLALLLSSLCVALTGHYGGTLAYVHGIGAQGRFLTPH